MKIKPVEIVCIGFMQGASFVRMNMKKTGEIPERSVTGVVFISRTTLEDRKRERILKGGDG